MCFKRDTYLALSAEGIPLSFSQSVTLPNGKFARWEPQTVEGKLTFPHQLTPEEVFDSNVFIGPSYGVKRFRSMKKILKNSTLFVGGATLSDNIRKAATLISSVLSIVVPPASLVAAPPVSLVAASPVSLIVASSISLFILSTTAALSRAFHIARLALQIIPVQHKISSSTTLYNDSGQFEEIFISFFFHELARQ